MVPIVAIHRSSAAPPALPARAGGVLTRFLRRLCAPFPPRRMPRRVLSLVLLALLVLAADAPGVLKPDPPVATLGNQVIREADFQRYLEHAYPPEQVAEINRNSSDRQNALEEYLDSVAIAAKARRAGIDQETRFEKARELMEMKTLSHLVTERYRDRILQSSQVSPEEVKTYYEQHQHELTVEPHFTAHHLLVYVQGNPAFPEKGLGDAEARARAKEALAQLRAGKSWDAVAKAYSDELATNQRGGLIRDAQFGYFAPEVERAVRTQELGKPGEVVKTVFGYHVIQVEDRITEREPRPFEQVKEMLTDRLSQQRSAEARKAFMTPIWEEVGFELREAAERDVSLLDDKAVAPEEILAEVGGKKILEVGLPVVPQGRLDPPAAHERLFPPRREARHAELVSGHVGPGGQGSQGGPGQDPGFRPEARLDGE